MDVLCGNVQIDVSPIKKMTLLAKMSQISVKFKVIRPLVRYNRKIRVRIFYAFPSLDLLIQS